MSNERPTDVGSGPGWAVGIGVTFIAVALATLAVVPVYLERSHHQLQDRLLLLDQIHSPSEGENLGVPALRALRMVQSQLESRVQQFAQTENEFYRESYRALLDQQSELVEEIGGWRTVLPDPEQLETLRRLIFEWQGIHHAPLMQLGSVSDGRAVTPAAFRPQLAEDDRRYRLVRDAVISLETVVTEEALVARRQLQFRESLQVWLTVASALVALIGLIVVIVLARYFRRLAAKEARRRHEAVAARREVRSVLEATGDGVIGLDLQGRCSFVNTAGARLLGYKQRDLLGRTIHDFIHHTAADGSPNEADSCPVAVAMRSGRAEQSHQEVLWRSDGRSFPVQLTAMPMTDGREVIGVVLTFADLTEVREVQAALQEAVKARDEVLAVVSHDLRNPVGTIGAASELLLDIPVTESQRREHLSIIHRSAERMGRLIQDLLDVAQIESGNIVLFHEPVDLVAISNEAMDEVVTATRAKGIRLCRPTLSEGSVVAEVDRYRVLQVLSNLLGNAIKFTAKGGAVTVEVEGTESDGWVSVSDSGPGIRPENIHHLFDRFWKGQRSGRKGAGLGLAIVDGIIDAHGGEVLVESELEKGSRFSVRLPLRPALRTTSGDGPPDRS